MENYDGFPIIPLWANDHHQSELVGLREQIDCYDLIKSGFANTVDEASFIYWAITGAGGMDDVDLAQFVERMKTVHAGVVDGAKAEAHSIEAPYESREALLDRLRRDLYEDYQALDVKEIASGAATATQIKAAYEPMNIKADQFEYCVIDFLQGIMKLAGIDDKPSFTRSVMINAQEEAQTVIMAASYLTEDYITQKLLEIFGDGDKAEEMLKEIDAENITRLRAVEQEEQPEEQPEEQG